jgi:hypothetical protein
MCLEESLVSISAPLLYWFSTLLCLLNVENMTSRTQSNHRLAARDSFVVDDYLSHVQEVIFHYFFTKETRTHKK